MPMNKQEKCHCSQQEMPQFCLAKNKTAVCVPLSLFTLTSTRSSQTLKRVTDKVSNGGRKFLKNLLLPPVLHLFPGCRKLIKTFYCSVTATAIAMKFWPTLQNLDTPKHLYLCSDFPPSPHKNIFAQFSKRETY